MQGVLDFSSFHFQYPHFVCMLGSIDFITQIYLLGGLDFEYAYNAALNTYKGSSISSFHVQYPHFVCMLGCSDFLYINIQ